MVSIPDIISKLIKREVNIIMDLPDYVRVVYSNRYNHIREPMIKYLEDHVGFGGWVDLNGMKDTWTISCMPGKTTFQIPRQYVRDFMNTFEGGEIV